MEDVLPVIAYPDHQLEGTCGVEAKKKCCEKYKKKKGKHCKKCPKIKALLDNLVILGSHATDYARLS